MLSGTHFQHVCFLCHGLPLLLQAGDFRLDGLQLREEPRQLAGVDHQGRLI